MPPATNPSLVERDLRRNLQIMGPGGADWSRDQAGAWLGLVNAHQSLLREFGLAIEKRHGLSPTALSLLGRLIEEPVGRLRVTALSADIGLSLSRTSRVIDGLEARGLVVRASCPQDARATNVHLTAAGQTIVREAQAASNAWVHEHFFSRLTDEEVASLASVLERFARPDGALECPSATSACDAVEPCDAAAD